MQIPLDPEQGAAFLLATLFLPLLVSVLKQTGFSTQVNAIVALVVYVAFAVAGALLSGVDLTAANLTPLIVAAIVAGRAAYSMFWSLIGGDDEGNGSIDDRLTARTSVVR